MTGDGIGISVWFLARASFMLALAGLSVVILNRWRPLNSVRWHRMAWTVVLLQGVILFPLTLQLELPERLAAAAARLQDVTLQDAGFRNELGVRNESGVRDDGRERQIESNLRQLDSENSSPLTTGGRSSVLDRPRPVVEGWQDVKPLWGNTSAERPAPILPDSSRRITELSQSDFPSGSESPRKEAAISGEPLQGLGIETMLQRVWSWFREIPRQTILSVAWLVGVVSILGILLSNFLTLQRSLRHCQAARPRWAAEFQGLCVELGVTQQVKLEVHPHLGPFLCWTPRGHRVVVPVRLWNRLSEAERLSVLHHELCHLRRGDLWKACVARLIVALHWFNPLAWYSARRFDESAEWACDARMASEAPSRVTPLANALLTASQSETAIPYLALSVTGGPLFQRVRRLVIGQPSGDSVMHKFVWMSLLAIVAGLGGVRLTWYAPTASAQETNVDEQAEQIEADEQIETDQQIETDEQIETDGADEEEDLFEDSAEDNSNDNPAAEDESSEDESTEDESDEESRPEADIDTALLSEFAQRIVAGDSESLSKFKTLLSSPSGQIVMADRAAVTAQEAASQVDMATAWQQFVDRYFERTESAGGERWIVRGEQAEVLVQYDQEVSLGNEEIEDVRTAFQEVSSNLVDKEELSKILQRFLQHEGAPAFVYHTELRARLHPGMDQLEERFQDHLVRTSDNGYAIRTARSKQVEKRLDFVARLQAPISRLQKELAAWADDLAREDELHQRFAETLRSADFARYVALSHVSEESRHIDEELDGIFGMLEEATSDTASGLKLDPESDQYREIQSEMDRFKSIWEQREALQAPLLKMAEGIEVRDELHQRLKEFLSTDMALIGVVREMDYLPVSAGDAAREWLAQIVTRNDSGKYEITLESPEDLNYRVEDYFRQFRELRRRGRIVDEFAAELQDEGLRKSMQSFYGKLNLGRIVEASVERPEVNGLALWFENHFEETPDGLVLHDWANEAIESVINEAAEIDSEMQKTDF